ALRDLLGQERPFAFRARLRDGLVPERELALRIVRAAEEHLPAARLTLDDVAGVKRADNAGLLELDVLALGIPGTGRELAEAALLDDEVFPAVGTHLVENLIGLGGG